MKVRKSDIVGQKIQAIRCAVSETPGDMGGTSVSYSKTAILLGNGIGIDLDFHEEPLLWVDWPAGLKRDQNIETLFSQIIGREVKGLYISDYYPCLVVLIEGDQIIGMNSPAPWCVLPTIEMIGKADISDLKDFFSDENHTA